MAEREEDDLRKGLAQAVLSMCDVCSAARDGVLDEQQAITLYGMVAAMATAAIAVSASP